MQYWVFDLDGTLIDSFQFYLDIVNDIFSQYGLSLPAQEIYACLGLPATKFFASYFNQQDLQQVLPELKKRTNEDALKIQAFSGIKTLLSSLDQRGKSIALWTSRDRESADMILRQTQLDQHIRFRVSGSCVEKHKPDPEGLHKISQHFSCSPSDMILIGDHDYDMQAAKSAGSKAVRASWHGHNPPASCLLADQHFYCLKDFHTWSSQI